MVDLEIKFTPYNFTPMSFHQAADYTAMKIAEKYTNIFVSFSGGSDSDYVCHCFHRNDIKFTPIIIKTNFNSIEMAYALHTCRKFNITPVIIDITDSEYLKIYKNNIIDEISSVGVQAVSGIIACRYAKEHDGVVIIGEHMIDNDNNNIWPGVNDWDFYNEVFVGEDYNIPFFNYTVEIAYAMIESIEQIPIDEWKWQTYEIDFRPKVSYAFPPLVLGLIHKLYNSRKYKPKTNFNIGSKEDFLNLLIPYIEKDKY
jgi:hypothetical protein